MSDEVTTDVAPVDYKPDIIFTFKKREPIAISLDLEALGWEDFKEIQTASALEDRVEATEKIITVISRTTDVNLRTVPFLVLNEVVRTVMKHFAESGSPKN